VPRVILNEPCVRALVGQGEAVRMVEHIRVSGQERPGQVRVIPDAAQALSRLIGRPAFTQKRASVSPFIFALSVSHVLMILTSFALSRCFVEGPFLGRATRSARGFRWPPGMI
jgi:hypothetical protein